MNTPQNTSVHQASISIKSWGAITTAMLTLLAVLMFLPTSHAKHASRTTISKTSAASTQQRRRGELPERWQWKRDVITFDHMFQRRR